MVGDDSLLFRVQVVTSTGLAITSASVVLRFAARRVNGQPHFLDDWLLMVALITFIVVSHKSQVIVCGCSNGAPHSEVSSVSLVLVSCSSWTLCLSREGLRYSTDRVVYLKLLYIGGPLYALPVVAVKLSMLFLHYRLLRSKRAVYAYHAVGLLVFVWGVTVTVLAFKLCIPLRKIWEPETQGYC